MIEALIVMAEYKIGALLVTDKDKMVGIISERDYAREIILHKKSSKETSSQRHYDKESFIASALQIHLKKV